MNEPDCYVLLRSQAAGIRELSFAEVDTGDDCTLTSKSYTALAAAAAKIEDAKFPNVAQQLQIALERRPGAVVHILGREFMVRLVDGAEAIPGRKGISRRHGLVPVPRKVDSSRKKVVLHMQEKTIEAMPRIRKARAAVRSAWAGLLR